MVNISSVWLLSTLWLSAVHAGNLYVSPSGSDSNDGTSEGNALLTLGAAQLKARDLIGDLSEDFYVYVAPGTYNLTEPLVFESQDSGSNGHKVIWQATDTVNGANISAGVQITDWTYYDQKNNIWKANVPKDSKSFHFYVNQKHGQRAQYSLSRSSLTLIENGFNINDESVQFLASLPGIENGQLRSRGSWTDRYMTIESVDGNNLIMANPSFNNNIIGFDTFTNPSVNFETIWLENVLGILDSVNEYYLDENASVVYYKPDDGVNMNDQYAVLPTLEVLLIVAGTYDEPVHDLTFQGFNYMHTTWNQPSSNLGFADQQTGGYLGQHDVVDNFTSTYPFFSQVPGSVQASAVKNLSFLNGSFSAIAGGLGVGNDPNACASPGVGLGASNVLIAGMLFHQTGSQPITIGGLQANAHHPSDPRMTNEYITVTENIFFDFGYTFSSSTAILSTYTTGTTLSNNDISNAPYSGICWGYGWGSNDAGGSPEYESRGLYAFQPKYDTPTTLKDGAITGNIISNMGTLHYDEGAIYTLSASPNTTINENCLWNAPHPATLYHDEGSRGYLDFDNVCATGNGYWLDRNEGNLATTGNLTVYNNWVQGDSNDGTNQYGDDVYDNTAWNGDFSTLDKKYQDYCYYAGIPPSERSSRPAQSYPVSGP
ncbi:xylanase A [Fusarium mundagurra]|uniref:Xylanase A n=1 Tax=Fusarium mundagurra TaxID=1567541 RepID=A0A8H6DMH7_9HYPO|nr:xylanase A [Fusarium mundagurra]